MLRDGFKHGFSEDQWIAAKEEARQPDHVPAEERYDGMDCFGLGGVLVDREDLDRVWDAHRGFCNAWGITYPLHSYEIRGGRGNFSWLKNPERAVEFLPELEEFLVSLPRDGNRSHHPSSWIRGTLSGDGLIDPFDPFRRVEPAVAKFGEPPRGFGDGNSARVVSVVRGLDVGERPTGNGKVCKTVEGL